MGTKIQANRLSSYGRLGVLLAVIGIILGVDTMANISFLYKFWPLLVTMLGVGFIGIYVRRGQREAFYMGTGTYLIVFSGLALYCSLTSWGELVTLWPVFIAILALSCIFGYFFGNRKPVMLLAGLILMSLAVLFYSVFSVSYRLWWIIFILAGLSFVIFDKVRQS